jgi:GT2 family glycosyltransferase
MAMTHPAPTSSDDTDLSTVEVSVIIPAYHGRRTIPDCIQSVERALRGRRAEIIVVESSADGTDAIVRRQFPHVRILAPATQVTAGEARNLGARAARGTFLFFVDQDCTVPEDWIGRLMTHLQDSRVGAAGGAIGIRNLSNLSGCCVYFLEFLNHFPSGRSFTRSHQFLLGCNLACRASLFDRIRFPDRTLAEDVLFSHAIRQVGLDVVYDPTIVVSHWNREGWREFLSYNRRMGRASAQYHRYLQSPSARLVLRFPPLIFMAPLLILPHIARNLLGAWGYLARFLALSPACLVGNGVWCLAFYRELTGAPPPLPPD